MSLLLNNAKQTIENMNYGELELVITLAIRKQREIKTELEASLKSEAI